MLNQWHNNVARADIVRFVQQAGQRYWPHGPLPRDAWPQSMIDLRQFGKSWCRVPVPAAHAAHAVDGSLWVDNACIQPGNGTLFDRCDWYLAAFAHLSAIAEWQHELAHGPIHSYALRLQHVPTVLFDHAWANRILLLLRVQEAAALGHPADEIFGVLADARIHLTHDVDAIDKTWPIRLKQGGFDLFNVARYFLQGKFSLSLHHARKATGMFLRPTHYDYLDHIAERAVAHGLRSVFHLHARPAKRSLKLWLMDPGYRIDDARIKRFVTARAAQGFVFGLHPSYDCWNRATDFITTRTQIQQALGVVPLSIRQHWLRFSLRDTWRAQAQAGFTLDYTLGFNERTGFRSGAALSYCPWDFIAGQPHALQTCPTMAMDSQFYAYSSMDADARKNAMAALVNEVKAVHGEIAVLWHPHTLAVDYGWNDGFEDMLALLGNVS